MAAKPGLMAALTILALWSWLPSAQAQQDNPGLSHKKFKQPKPTERQGKSEVAGNQRKKTIQTEADLEKKAVHIDHGILAIGGFFQTNQRDAALDYFGHLEKQGFCPPGLAKKSTSCLPPGQSKKWRQGYPLPEGVVYYELPHSLILRLGVPPNG
jgi:hypothetical protein